jgi:hypothetical protein
MLEHKRTPLFRVAFHTRLFVRQSLLDHARPFGIPPRGRKCAVRVMAIGANDHPFVDAVLERHGKLRTNVGMAAIAKLGLRAGQQKLRHRRFVNGMAIRTHHVVLAVRRPPDVRSGERLRVTAEAFIENLLWLELGKCNDRRLSAARRNVGAAGSVAALASGVLGFLLAGSKTLEVRILVKLRPDVGMACLTRIAADKTLCRVCFAGQRQRREDREKENGSP